jgi:Tol biopolymer transport system component
VLAISPDGTTIPVLKDGSLWLLTYPGGAARQTAIETAGLTTVSWMPDSRRFVSEVLQGQRFGMAMTDIETGMSRTISLSSTGTLNPGVSPDGTRLAFIVGDVRWKLVEVSVGDGRVRDLRDGNVISWFPSLSPDGTRLAFAGGMSPTDLRELPLASPSVATTRIATFAAERLDVARVEWSPDGARILFAASPVLGNRRDVPATRQAAIIEITVVPVRLTMNPLERRRPEEAPAMSVPPVMNARFPGVIRARCGRDRIHGRPGLARSIPRSACVVTA